MTLTLYFLCPATSIKSWTWLVCAFTSTASVRCSYRPPCGSKPKTRSSRSSAVWMQVKSRTSWQGTFLDSLCYFCWSQSPLYPSLLFSVFNDEVVNPNEKLGINHHNLLEPFYINVAINLNNYYNPTYKKQELFKYKFTTLVSKLILTTTPDLCRDMMQFVSFQEMFSYNQDLKKYRPTMRL